MKLVCLEICLRLMVTQFDFLKKRLKKFNEKIVHSHSSSPDYVYNLNIPYFGRDSRCFLIKLKNIIKSKVKITLKINPIYKMFKVSHYFQLKIRVPPHYVQTLFISFCVRVIQPWYVNLSFEH